MGACEVDPERVRLERRWATEMLARRYRRTALPFVLTILVAAGCGAGVVALVTQRAVPVVPCLIAACLSVLVGVPLTVYWERKNARNVLDEQPTIPAVRAAVTRALVAAPAHDEVTGLVHDYWTRRLTAIEPSIRAAIEHGQLTRASARPTWSRRSQRHCSSSCSPFENPSTTPPPTTPRATASPSPATNT